MDNQLRTALRFIDTAATLLEKRARLSYYPMRGSHGHFAGSYPGQALPAWNVVNRPVHPPSHALPLDHPSHYTFRPLDPNQGAAGPTEIVYQGHSLGVFPHLNAATQAAEKHRRGLADYGKGLHEVFREQEVQPVSAYDPQPLVNPLIGEPLVETEAREPVVGQVAEVLDATAPLWYPGGYPLDPGA